MAGRRPPHGCERRARRGAGECEARFARELPEAHRIAVRGALESTAASRLPPLLATYHRRYPDVTVELKTGTNDVLTAAVAERALDAAFVAERPSNDALASTPAFGERLVIVAPAAHAPIARPGDIDGLSLIAFPDGCAYRRVMQRWLGARRISFTRVLSSPRITRSSHAWPQARASPSCPNRCWQR